MEMIVKMEQMQITNIRLIYVQCEMLFKRLFTWKLLPVRIEVLFVCIDEDSSDNGHANILTSNGQ